MFRTTRLSGLCSVRVCSSCTRRTWKTKSRNMASVSTRLQTTRSYMSTVVATKWRPPSYDSRTALRKLATGSANRLKLNADKTELLWAGSRHGPAMLGSTGPSLRLRTEKVVASDQVRVLGVTMTSALSLDKYVANVCGHAWTTVTPFSLGHPSLPQTIAPASYECRCPRR